MQDFFSNLLGETELRQIAEIELRRVQERICSSGATPFVFRLTEAAFEQLLAEGTDCRYGARHLRRAIDRLLVQPISNLLATEQVRRGDWVKVDADPESREIFFLRLGPADALAEVSAVDNNMSRRFPAGIRSQAA